jgi:hypothetical protein
LESVLSSNIGTGTGKGLNGVGFLNNIVEISQGKGGNHSLALDSSGTIWAWGYNGHEQCGVATWSSEPREITAPVNISFVPALSAASVSIVPPAAGGIPQGAAEVEAATANADYTVTGITWNEDMTAGGKFKAGQIYTATVTLTSKNGKSSGLPPLHRRCQELPPRYHDDKRNRNRQYRDLHCNISCNGSINRNGHQHQGPALRSELHLRGSAGSERLVITLTYNDFTTEDVAFTNFAAKSITANRRTGPHVGGSSS